MSTRCAHDANSMVRVDYFMHLCSTVRHTHVKTTAMMKSIQFTVLFAAVFAASAFEKNEEEPLTLKERWEISRPKVIYEHNDLKTLALSYDISDYPQPNNVKYQLMRGEDCTEFMELDNEYVQAKLVFDDKKEGTHAQSVTMKFTVQEADKANSPLFSTDEESNILLQFCTRFSLHTSKGMLVNWIDTHMTVHVVEEEEEQEQLDPVVLKVSEAALKLRASR